jgi:predicted ATPase
MQLNSVLSFDELQLVDATSAAMLRDVLSWYWRMGGIIIATSVSHLVSLHAFLLLEVHSATFI